MNHWACSGVYWMHCMYKTCQALAAPASAYPRGRYYIHTQPIHPCGPSIHTSRSVKTPVLQTTQHPLQSDTFEPGNEPPSSSHLSDSGHRGRPLPVLPLLCDQSAQQLSHFNRDGTQFTHDPLDLLLVLSKFLALLFQRLAEEGKGFLNRSADVLYSGVIGSRPYSC